ncbi:hypothetical protein [Luteimonas sp. MC1750]|uniref:hypothetical protein n=1 Tax=Luteimonas sp. MC1750 TaxID=2799326 RepID=UPI0018F0F003|nr:hypothetical protein [Luteimonas sp. MC1750]
MARAFGEPEQLLLVLVQQRRQVRVELGGHQPERRVQRLADATRKVGRGKVAPGVAVVWMCRQ